VVPLVAGCMAVFVIVAAGASLVGGTLRAAHVSALSLFVGSFVSAGWLTFSFRSMLICLRVLVSVSVNGGNGDPVVGFFSAWRMSLVLLAMMSADDTVSISVWVGSHMSVSAIRSHFVSIIQTR